MKYSKFTILFLMFLTTLSFSQDYSGKKFKIGLNLGANLSDFNGSVYDKYSPVTSYSFGLSVEYIISEKWSLLSNINYDNKIMKFENFRTINLNGDYFFVDTKTIFNYLNIPLNLRYNIGKRNNILADAGIFYNYFLNLEHVTTRQDTGEKGAYFSKPRIKKYDYGFLIGFGYRFNLGNKNYLSFIVRDEFGLPNLYDYKTNSSLNLKTNTLKLILNWQFLI
ncbi:outer membrane beta-barrel protein [Flavivirga eckloniae]|uniref:Outer membrane protein beta-barrel domain-containing protein n=1 Tax=Flavivirga eckloniae TaxID=1803846 RepID=A0A2K9PQJ3_9FLAO|nr:outer membrane beta-barrel protein [Flavivirga eckloniae]AUP79343.1 hypothetical protein C1H87_11745 [Flavivirga eckloniae]